MFATDNDTDTDTDTVCSVAIVSCPAVTVDPARAPRSARQGPPSHKAPPPAFAETFVRHGWRGVEAAFGSRTSCNVRWIAQCGGDALKQARLAYRLRLAAIKQGGAHAS